MEDKQLFIIRHGETELNRKRIIQGQGVDAPLNQTGRKQGVAFYQYYKSQKFEVVLTSSLIRTKQTVAPFIQAGLPSEQFADINEIDWGIHEGKEGKPWMIQAYKELIENWSTGNYDARLEEGESAAELLERLTRFVDHLKLRPERNLLICCHGRAMRCLMCILKGQHLKEMENYKHQNTGLYKINYNKGQFYFELENDTRHLNNLDF